MFRDDTLRRLSTVQSLSVVPASIFDSNPASVISSGHGSALALIVAAASALAILG